MSAHIRFISAGAGSGKTYRITEDLEKMLASGNVRPSGVIATTFTRMAATELRERVRQKLISAGKAQQAAQMGQALIGTVNSVCGELLSRFAFEAGLSPVQKVLEEEAADRLFAAALEAELREDQGRIRRLNRLSRRFELQDSRSKKLLWRKAVMKIAGAARANNMTPDEVRAFGPASADSLLAHFQPPYQARDLDAELKCAMDAALAAFDPSEDGTGVSKKYFDHVRGARRRLQRDALAWSDWVRIANGGPGAKSRIIAEPLKEAAGLSERHEQLQNEMRELLTELFELAAASIEAYQAYKERQGMLDFVDQEQRVYQLLDHPHVQTTLGEELQVLLVDEFQDTSPIQLALFMKLAKLADQVVWVGDIKQAIYGFRGSDTALMQAVVAGVEAGGGTTDVLPYSWRSRPALVDYVNEIYEPTFVGEMPAGQVGLEAKRKEQGERTAVATWLLSGNWGQKANSIARGIANLVEARYPVTDKQTGELRDSGWGDIAVLCRSNDRLAQIATACANAGIPVAYKRFGLLKTPEGALAMACLRRLADPRDTLASAEIRTLTGSESPEAWLTERLDYLAGEEDHWTWGVAGHDAIAELEAIDAAHAQVNVLTPTEAMELALRAGKVREAGIAWGPTADNARHRLRNIDLLIEYAKTYEDQCNMQNVAATIAGLILWLKELAKRKEDYQAEASDGRAVTIVTHHRAKGLEWPIVVAVDLDADVESRLWDLTVRPREADFDMFDPLAGRSLRYWLWPYGGLKKDIPLLDRVKSSTEGTHAQAQAEAEIRRLLYVSMTRARDLLVMPLPEKNPSGEWLRTLAVEWAVPNGETLELPSGKVIKTACETIEAPEDWSIDAPDYEARWVATGKPRDDLLKRDLNPSSAAAIDNASAGEIVEIGEALELQKHLDEVSLGQAFHTIIAAEINSPDDQAASRAARVLVDWGFEGVIEPVDALAVARRFIAWAKETFSPITWHVECPMTHVLDTGQVVQGSIDLLLETNDGWVIIDHKATQKPRSMWQDVAISYSGQLAMYRAAVEAVTDKPVRGAWIHLAIGGGVVPILETR